MARTVGLPIAMACKLVLNGKLADRGVLLPLKPVIYDPVLDELERFGVVFREEEWNKAKASEVQHQVADQRAVLRCVVEWSCGLNGQFLFLNGPAAPVQFQQHPFRGAMRHVSHHATPHGPHADPPGLPKELQFPGSAG